MRSSAIAPRVLLAIAVACTASGDESDLPWEPSNPDLSREADAAVLRDRAVRETRSAEEARRRQEREAAQDAALEAAGETERAAAVDLEHALSEAQAMQNELVRINQDSDMGSTSTGLLAAPHRLSSESWDHDPRIAAPPPPERDLPMDIFDRSDETIAAGTWHNTEKLRVIRLVLDADGDAKPELIRFVDRTSREPIREEADRNYDGMMDSWKNYREGELVSRILDANDDGNPDVFETYRQGLLVIRELDRDDDGVRDVFYRYRGDSLFEEGHDADNDGTVDLLIVYHERRRVRAEEDVDRDGRVDQWTRYAAQGEGEEVAQIDHDRHGRGFADTFEYFQIRDGKTLLVRRERDINGDGRVDVVSFYAEGRLERRQISDANLLPL
jgi:hypothetical protein